MHRNNASAIHIVGNSRMGGYDVYQKNLVLPKVGPLVQSKLFPPPQQMQRTVLGVIRENDQRPRSLSLDTASTKLAPGTENVAPLAIKAYSANADVAPKPCFTIYVDDPEDNQENCSFEMQLPGLEASETNKQKFHLLLDISAASPMMMDTSLQCQPELVSETDPEAAVVAEYIDEIHQCLREAEVKHRPKPYYMKKQPDITSAMRTILVDWLAEVREEYKLSSETLFLAINYLDRFLSCMSVLRGKLQLVGIAAVLLASKYEEIYPPEIDEFVYITDDTYTKKQLLRMEHLLLKVLAFDLTVPTINQFLLQYIHKHTTATKTEHLAMYMAELTLLEEHFLQYLPSITAAAAYGLANYTVNGIFWPENLQDFTGYVLSDLAPCLVDLHRACLNAPHQAQQAIREKYKSPMYMQVSLMVLPATLPL